MSYFRNYLGFLVVVVISVLLILPFFKQGFFPMHDDTQVARVHEMSQAITDGQFPVRWVENLGYGYGYPIFNFYAPFPYYVGAAFEIIGFDALLATKVTFILAIILSGVFMYLFVRDLLNEEAGIVASVIYMYFPYHAVNTYVRGALSELWAYAFLPLVFWGIWRLYIYSQDKNNTLSLSFLRKQESRETGFRVKPGMTGLVKPFLNKWVLITALSFTFVILSHNLTAYMVAIFAGLAMLVAITFSKYKLHFIALFGVSIFLALLLSSFYIIPVIFENSYTNVLSQIGKTADFSDHFVCFEQLWNSPWGFGGSTPTCVDGLSFKLGKINILFTIFSIIFVLYLYITNKSHKRRLFFVLIAGLVLSIILLLPISEVVWIFLPGMEYLQYPWRFLNFAGFTMAIIIGFGVYHLSKKYGNKLGFLISGIIIALTIFFNAKLFVPSTINANNSSYYTSKNTIQWDSSRRSDEYLPVGFQKPLDQNDLPSTKVFSRNLDTQIDIKKEKAHEVQLFALASKNDVIHFNIAYFPSWKAYLNGKKLEIKSSINGFDVGVPAGSHEIIIRFENTPSQLLGNILTLIGIIGIVIAIILINRSKFYDKKTS